MPDKQKKILFLENNKAQFDLLKAQLEVDPKWSFELVWASPLNEASLLCRQQKFDLLLLDYHLRSECATCLIEEVRSIYNDVPPFIFMSNEEHHEEEIDREAIKFGAVDYMHKGNFDVKTLARIIRYAVTNYAMQRNLSASQKELAQMVTRDHLTGISNRPLFVDRLEHAIQRMTRSKRPYVVMLIDLDRFKWINDSMGHAAGDELLQIVTEKLKSTIRATDSIARLGGDEFAILMEDLSPAQQIQQSSMIAMRFLESLSQPISVRDQLVYTSASIGIVLGSLRYTSADQVMRDADLAMYRAKDMGKGCYQFYDAGMHEEAVENLKLASDLQLALATDSQLMMYYQPIVELATRKIIGYESLIRWQHPTRGLLMPGSFLKQAEDAGMMDRIGGFALKHSLIEFASFKTDNPGDHYISVNLAAEQIINHRIIDDIQNYLDELGLKPHHLQIEITENSIMKSPDLANRILTRLRDMGMRIAIDDFGSGYSSLSYLQKFPVTTIKIDRSFVTNLRDRKENREIVKMVTVLAQAIGASVVAEGVETKDDQDMLISLGCTYGQGYYYGRPQREFFVLEKKNESRLLA